MEEFEVPKLSRKWTSTSAAISVLVHAVLIVLSVFVVALQFQQKPAAVFDSPPPPRPRLEPRKLEMKVRVQQLQKRSARPKLQPRLASMRPSDIAVPEIKTPPKKVSKEVKRNFSSLGAAGNGLGIGGGTGSGLGGGAGGLGLPPQMADRCNPVSRMNRLIKSGGSPECETAVVKGLTWLANNQNPDGSWGSNYRVAMTGLALLAFLGHCETPDSELFGTNVLKAMEYLVKKGKGDSGFLRSNPGGHFSYEHGIAAYALAESYTLTREPMVEQTVRQAIQIIIDGQASDGGWDYTYEKGMPSDTSVSGWQIQALKAAYLTKLEIPGVEQALDMAMKNILRVKNDDGHIGYRGRGGYVEAYGKGGLDGVGAYSLQSWKHGEMKHTRDILNNILDQNKGWQYVSPNTNLYRAYYDTLACFQREGATWRRWNEYFQKSTLAAQLPDGSWPPVHNDGAMARGTGNDRTAQVYRNALTILMLEVFYRYLPATS